MQPSAAHGTAFRRSPALCKASGFMTGTAQSRKAGENLIKENQKPNRRNFDKGIKIYKGVKKTAAKAFPKREFNLRHCFHLFLRANILSAHGSC